MSSIEEVNSILRRNIGNEVSNQNDTNNSEAPVQSEQTEAEQSSSSSATALNNLSYLAMVNRATVSGTPTGATSGIDEELPTQDEDTNNLSDLRTYLQEKLNWSEDEELLYFNYNKQTYDSHGQKE